MANHYSHRIKARWLSSLRHTVTDDQHGIAPDKAVDLLDSMVFTSVYSSIPFYPWLALLSGEWFAASRTDFPNSRLICSDGHRGVLRNFFTG